MKIKVRQTDNKSINRSKSLKSASWTAFCAIIIQILSFSESCVPTCFLSLLLLPLRLSFLLFRIRFFFDDWMCKLCGAWNIKPRREQTSECLRMIFEFVYLIRCCELISFISSWIYLVAFIAHFIKTLDVCRKQSNSTVKCVNSDDSKYP